MALVAHTPAGDRESFTGAELRAIVDGYAAMLHGTYGVTEGSVVGLHMDRGVAFVAMLLACSRLGAHALPMPLECVSPPVSSPRPARSLVVFISIGRAARCLSRAVPRGS